MYFICQDGKEASGVIVAAYFVFCKLFKNPNGAADMFSIRRCGIGHKVSLTASQERYVTVLFTPSWFLFCFSSNFPPFLNSL